MRHNIFNKVYLPLKTALLSGCISLSKIATDTSALAKEILEIIDKSLDTYKEQISYETLHVMPLIFEYEPFVVNNYTTDHSKIKEVAKYLNGLLQSYQSQQKNNPVSILISRSHGVVEPTVKPNQTVNNSRLSPSYH